MTDSIGEKNGLQLPERIPVSKYQQIDGGLDPRIAEHHARDAANAKALNWQERANYAEALFLQMVNERKLLQVLLLEQCRKLREMKFSCQAGPLESCTNFLDIENFAKGTPAVERPPLEVMPLDGTRAVRKVNYGKEIAEVFLECGHTVEMAKSTAENLDRGGSMTCRQCVLNLKQYGMYDDTIDPDTIGDGGSNADPDPR